MKPTPYPPLGLRRPLLTVLLPLLALAFQPARATTYYFSWTGNNAWDGLTINTPKKDLSVAQGLAVPGNVILFKRGDVWSHPSYSLRLLNQAGMSGSEIYIGAYNVGPVQLAKPVISTLLQVSNSGWTRVGSTTTWQKSIAGYPTAWRLYVNGVSKAKITTTNPNDVNQTYEWYIQPINSNADGMLYVCTGSTVNAPQNVEVQVTGSQPPLVITGNSSEVYVQNLEFRGGSQYNVVQIDAPAKHLSIDNCVVQRGRWNGILVSNEGSNTADYVDDITISNCTVDRTWTPQEDNVFYAGGDGIVFHHAVDHGVIFNNVVKNWPHTGIEAAAYRPGFHGVHNINIEQNKVTADQSGYMHAYSVYGYEEGATDILVRRNFFYDFTSTCHSLGNRNKYYSNIFARIRRTTLTVTNPANGQPHSKQPYGIDMANWYSSTAGNTPAWIVAHDNIVANNTFYDVDEFPIYLYEDPAGPSLSNNLFYNNIMVKYGDGVTSPDVGLKVQPTVDGNVYVRNNNFWDSAADPAAVALYKTASYSAAGLSSVPGGYCSNNKQLDAKLQDPANNVFALTSGPTGSPEDLRSGGLDISGLMDPDFKDYEGKAWKPTHPSMGAIQVPFTP